MKAAGMVIHVIRFRRVKLNYAVLRLKEQVFNRAHYSPAWRLGAFINAHRHMTPPTTIGRHSLNLGSKNGQKKHAVKTILRRAGIWPGCQSS